MDEKYINIETCWCGSKILNRFSDRYIRCEKCQTLINSPRLPDDFFEVNDDEKDIYGKKYWLEHQSEKYGYSNILNRSREDLSERCIYWLSKILKYKLPPAKTVELGCGHGGLVALMKSVGFEATGAELSDWVINYAKNCFGVNVLKGKIEDLKFKPRSLDCIIMMDVIEHFTNLRESLGYIEQALTHDGIVVIQTPCYNETNLSYEEFKQQNHIFLEQMKEEEHLYLFTPEGLKQILTEFGFNNIYFEQPIFPYDMFVIASKSPIKLNSEDQIEQYLSKTPDGRFMQALIDLYEKTEALKLQLKESDSDRAARLEVINKLDKQLKESESDRKARLELIDKLDKQLKKSESDRKARLELIDKLDKQLKESEADRNSRLELINKLSGQIMEIEADRGNRLELINNLNQLLKNSEADRAHKMDIVNRVQILLAEKDDDLSKQLELISSLQEKLNVYEPDGKYTLKAKLIKLIKRL